MKDSSNENTAIGLIALDLDGTLVQRDQSVLPADVAAVREAGRRGVKVVLASARPPRAVRETYEALGLDTAQVNYNGALVQHPREEDAEDWHHQPMDAALAKEVAVLARQTEPAVVVDLEVRDRWLTDRVHPNLRTQTSLRFPPDRVAPLAELFDEPVTKLMLLASTPRIARLREAVEAGFAGRVKIVVSDRHLIQVVHPDVDKADGVRRVAARYGVEAGAVLAVGDAPNDAGMLRWAGVGVAVGNGWDEAKAAADHVGPMHKQGAVAWAIERFVLGG